MSNTRRIETFELPSGIGERHHIKIFRYGPENATKKAYLQCSLHADEIPALLVGNHLIHLLDALDSKGLIQEAIYVVPFANPIGLHQYFLGMQVGRFHLGSGTNFNRDYPDYTQVVIDRVKDKLKKDDTDFNVKLIRSIILEEVHKANVNSTEKALKYKLYEMACDADIVFDLHCDTNALMHIYTHDRLWPTLADLSADIESHCQFLSPVSGGNPFDEAASCPWAALQDAYPEYNIPFACEAATLELRGETDVSDELASKDAKGLIHFFQRRKFIGVDPEDPLPPLPTLIQDATPLSGVDMFEAPCSGVVTWKVKTGDFVEKDQLLGEIVSIDDPYKPRVPLTARNAGVIFSVRTTHLVHAGKIMIKVAGKDTLEWRKGNLLTAK